MNDPSPDERVVPPTVPPVFRDGAYQAVRAAWVAGHTAGDPTYPPLAAALARLASIAREHDVPIVDVIRTLDAICGATLGGDPSLDWDHVRSWAGRTVIRAYYRAD